MQKPLTCSSQPERKLQRVISNYSSLEAAARLLPLWMLDRGRSQPPQCNTQGSGRSSIPVSFVICQAELRFLPTMPVQAGCTINASTFNYPVKWSDPSTASLYGVRQWLCNQDMGADTGLELPGIFRWCGSSNYLSHDRVTSLSYVVRRNTCCALNSAWFQSLFVRGGSAWPRWHLSCLSSN